MGFALFLLVNAALFLRPEELIPGVKGIYLYQNSIIACMLCSITPVSQLFFASPLRRHPAFTCFSLLLPIAFFSLLLNRDIGQAFDELITLIKVYVYFVLLLALVTTPARLRALTAVIIFCTMIIAVVGILHFEKVISMPALEILEGDEADYGSNPVRRLQFTGMLNDPNEVAVFLSALTFLCAFQWRSQFYGFGRHIWLIPIAVFLVAIGLTKSRGGLLALLAGIAAFAVYRFQGAPGLAPGVHGRRTGAWKAVAFLVLAMPLMLVFFGGRQTEFGLEGSTGQGRIALWSDWLQEFGTSPLWGISPAVASAAAGKEQQLEGGKGVRVRALRETGPSHLAHNSYLQAFADLGFLGGTCFLGAFLLAFITLHRYAFGKTWILDPDQQRLHPHLVAALAAYMTGMLTLTINYLVTTAFILALPLTFYGMTRCYPPVAAPRLDMGGVGRLLLCSFGFMAFTYLVARFFRGY